MTISAEAARLLDRASPAAAKAKLGTELLALQDAATAATASKRGTVLRGVAVADAAGSAPTKAEFDALLASLRTAGVIAAA